MKKWEELEPWDRQPGEDNHFYQYFVIYRDLGPGRSLPDTGRKVAEIENISFNAAMQRIRRIYKKWDWQLRADLWDRNNDRLAESRLAKRRMDARIQHAAAGRLLLQAGIKRLMDLDPANLTIREAINCVRWGVHVEALALGMETERKELTVADVAFFRQLFQTLGAEEVLNNSNGDSFGNEEKMDFAGAAE